MLDGVNVKAGDFNGLSCRYAVDGGYLMYRMAVADSSPLYLYVMYCARPNDRLLFDLQVDGCTIATVDSSVIDRDWASTRYESYEIPPALVAGKQYVTIKFRAKKGHVAGWISAMATVRGKMDD